MSLIKTQKLSIYYERSSKRENGPLLYIGGTGGDLRNKPNQMDSPLKDFFEVISYDQRGLGQTSKPKEEYTMKQYADDAADFIDKLDRGEAVTSGEILKRFIEKHECCPIYMLCNKCHHKYDHS